ncbi:MAG: Glycerol uptake facilitator protein [Turneriella sp.]|nr:Glycerol uptake facilitator protein [Turneriella sp.]
MVSAFWGEFLGTMTLIALGNGVVAAVLLEKSKAQNAGWVAIATGWALAVTFGIFIAKAFGSADAHLNPAVTLAFAIQSGSYEKIPLYFTAQFAGAFVGAVLVFLHYLPHWKITQNGEYKLAAFATAPAVRQSFANFLSEAIGTLMLVFGVYAVFSKNAGGITQGLGPFLVGMLVYAIGLSLGGTTGYAINPARDFSPRLAHALLPIFGKRNSDWRYAWVPVLAPFAAGAFAGLLLRLI